MIKRRTNKFKLLIVILLIVSGIFINVYDLYVNYKANKLEEDSVDNYFVSEEKKQPVTEKRKEKEKQEVIDYIAILEIPKINLKKGLVDPNSYMNNVNINIEILKPYAMPDQKESNLFLASHSGSSRVAFFDDLDLLSIDDDIYIYYKQKKYEYKIINKF